MDRLILHIGTQKTGTTSLQSFFMHNRHRLAAVGVDFPWFPGFRKKDPGKNGLFLALMHGQEFAPWPTTVVIPGEQSRNALIKAARLEAEAFHRYAATAVGTALLSAEGIFRSGTLHEGFWSITRDWLASVMGTTARVEAVVYLRRQDLYIVSLWKQRVKALGDEARSFKEFIDSREARALLNYDVALARIETCFGRDALIVRRYDPPAFVGGDIFRDFCAAINIPWDDGFVLPEQRENPSLGCTATEIKRLANMAESYRMTRNFLKHPALAASLAHPEPPGSTPLSPEEAKALLAEYEEGNRRVAERYLGGEPLFPEPYQFGPTWKRNDAAVLDAAITMFAEALAEQQIRIKDIEKLLGMPVLLKIKRLLTGLRVKRR